jgi:hypothetical protein
MHVFIKTMFEWFFPINLFFEIKTLLHPMIFKGFITPREHVLHTYVTWLSCSPCKKLLNSMLAPYLNIIYSSTSHFEWSRIMLYSLSSQPKNHQWDLVSIGIKIIWPKHIFTLPVSLKIYNTPWECQLSKWKCNLKG